MFDGVPVAIVIVPSGFNVNPVGTVIGVRVTSTGFKIGPFNVSLSSTLGVVPPLGTGPKTSSIASIATTTTLAVAVSQFVGFNTSQIW